MEEVAHQFRLKNEQCNALSSSCKHFIDAALLGKR